MTHAIHSACNEILSKASKPCIALFRRIGHLSEDARDKQCKMSLMNLCRPLKEDDRPGRKDLISFGWKPMGRTQTYEAARKIRGWGVYDEIEVSKRKPRIRVLNDKGRYLYNMLLNRLSKVKSEIPTHSSGPIIVGAGVQKPTLSKIKTDTLEHEIRHSRNQKPTHLDLLRLDIDQQLLDKRRVECSRGVSQMGPELLSFNPYVDVVGSTKPIEVNNIMSKFNDKQQKEYASPVSRHLDRFRQTTDDKGPASIAKVIASLGITKSDATSYPPEVYNHPLSEYQQRQLSKPSPSIVNYEPGSVRSNLYKNYYDKIESNGLTEHLSDDGKYRLSNAITTKLDKGQTIVDPIGWAKGVCRKLMEEQELNQELKNEQRAIAHSSVESTTRETSNLHDIDTGTLEYRKAVVARNKEIWASMGINVGARRNG